MRLSKKTFCYSILISLILVVFVVLYFSLMLPSLYVDYMQKEYLDSIVKVQEGYSKNRSYQGLEVNNPTGSASLEVPFEGNSIYLAGKAFRIAVEIKDEEIRSMADAFRDAVRKAESWADAELPEVDFDKIRERFELDGEGLVPSLFSLEISADKNMEGMETRKVKIHRISDTMFVYEGGMKDGDNDYTTYIAVGKTDDAVILSFLPVMTPQMKEIRPIVLGSLPMITAVVFLLVLIASQVFSRKIVNPVIRLAGYAEEVKNAGYTELAPMKIREKDEIGELGSVLNELYEKLRRQYQELEEKNRALVRENKRQEVFLRASSHQLKTPVTAALLLTEGMLSEIGKYKDMKKYLPEVKKQLLSMRRIVEDILYLNHSADHILCEETELNLLIKEVLECYRIPAEERRLQIFCEERTVWVSTDRELMRKILDNLISNAVSYTSEGGSIAVHLSEEYLEVCNREAHIEEELLPHIYEPFVSSDASRKGRGLGLYVISYYVEILGLEIHIKNQEQGVAARLYLKK